MADCSPRHNPCRLRIGLLVEGKPFWVATSRHHLVYGRHRRLLCCYCSSCRIRSENQIVGEGHTQNRSCDGGLNMQITEITIHPTNEDLVKAYVSIVFDNCFMVKEIRVMQGPTGLFLSFPTKKLRDGTQRDIAFPANAETRRIIEQAILAQYEKVVGGGDVPPSTTVNKHQG